MEDHPMKKWLTPLIFSFISIIVFLLSGAVVSRIAKGNLGGAVLVLIVVLIYCLIGMPIMSFLYSKRCLAGQRLSILFTVYQSFMTTLPYLIWFLFLISEPFRFVLVLWPWCEIWSLIGLIKTKRNK